MVEKVLEVSRLYKSFTVGKGTLEVLKNLKFEVYNKEFVSIMGPSGCGKSTLLYLMGGLDSPSSGDIKIFGQNYNSLSEKVKSKLRRTRLGFIFQFYNLIPNLSVEDNILLPVLIDGKKPKEYSNKLDEILDIIGMEKRRKYTPRELSGGQQQKTAIARALLMDPDLILADEPIGNLDSKSGKDIMDLFQRINVEMGKTIVQVTHIEEASYYDSRIISMRDGTIESDCGVT